MYCPKCGSALRANKSYMTFINDDTPDKPTEAYTNIEMVCLNQVVRDHNGKEGHCLHYNQVLKTVSHKAN